MATYELNRSALAPSDWSLLPAINQRFFAGSDLLPQRDLIGGSRYILRLTYDHRSGAIRDELENIFEAASVPGDDVRVHFSTLGHKLDKVPVVHASTKANAGTRMMKVRVSNNPIVKGTLFSRADRIYKCRNNVAVNTGGLDMTIGWPLRAPINANSILEFNNPTARFVVIRDPPVFPRRLVNAEGKRILGGPIVVELMELM